MTTCDVTNGVFVILCQRQDLVLFFFSPINTLIMSDVQLYLISPDARKEEGARIASHTAQSKYLQLLILDLNLRGIGLQSKDLKLVALIESLGEYLNNDDAKIRAKSAHHSTSIHSASA